MPIQQLFAKKLKFVSQKLKFLRTKFCFPSVFLTSKCAPLLVKCNFVRPAKIFFPLVRNFFSVSEKIKNQNSDSWSKKFRHQVVSCVCRMHLWEGYRIFCQKPEKEWFMSRWPAPEVGKTISWTKLLLKQLICAPGV